MENLDMKRARLRLQLQEAYGASLRITHARANAMSPRPAIELSGSPKESRAEWLDHLAAKERLMLAYAEHPVAA